ncbi:MAG: hypothetical protein ACHQ16_07545, partial [Candidatus Lutacidiplasmatales archaeon]
VFLDGFTHFAVTPFLPFSLRQLRLDADVAINIVMLTLTSVTLVTLSVERGVVPFGIWVETAWLLTAIYGGYLLLRGVARWRAAVARDREGYSTVAPTTDPRVWTLLDVQDTAVRYRVRYRRYRFGESTPSPEHSMAVNKLPPSKGPVRNAQEALERTYLPAMERNRWMATRAHAGEAVERGDVFEVRWFIVEVAGFGRTLGVRGQIDRTSGEMRLRSGFFRRPSASAG